MGNRIVPGQFIRGCSGTSRLSSPDLVLLAPLLLAQAFPGKRLLGATLFAGLHIEAVFFDFLDDVFLLHLALETAQSVFKRLTFLDYDFSHAEFTPHSS